MNYTSTGSTLRAERLRQGLSLADLSKRTRISQRFLADIEADKLDALPGLVFARSFVKTYAVELKLDPDPLLEDLPLPDIRRSQLPLVDQRESSNWDPRWNSLLAAAGWTVLALGTCVAAYVHFSRPDQAVAPLGQNQAANTESAVAKPTANVASSTASAHPVRVVLTAREPAWVQITADGRNSFTGVLQANDTREIDADELIKLTTGNAGGVAVTLNEKALDSLGTIGQVRTVRLTAEGPQFASKTPQPQLHASDPL